jgi:hypothetical protein
MEISVPTWNSNNMSYSFRIGKCGYQVEQTTYYEAPNGVLEFPASPTVSETFVRDFLEKTKKYFTTPLTAEKVLRHLRHTVAPGVTLSKSGWFRLLWKPSVFIVKSGDFTLAWEIAESTEAEVVIPADFTGATTPRAQSPAVPEQTRQDLRQIQIHDSLIPVGDLPLSDLPALSFAVEDQDPEKDEIRRRVREARLKVQLAKLKAQRMEQKYYERYGQAAGESEDSSDFSSDSEEEELTFGRSSHS